MHPFEIVAEPVRLRIIEMLCSGEHSAGQIEEAVGLEFGVGRTAIQHHLRVLKREGWVIVREEWTSRYYRLEEFVVPRLESSVRRLRRRWNRRIGWVGGVDIYVPKRDLLSKRGRRGYGMDPDDPWRRGR